MRLALLCLSKFMKKQPMIFSQRTTVCYNSEKVDSKLYLYLALEEQQFLRVMRSQYCVSVSYLVSISIEMFLTGLVRALSNNRNHNCSRKACFIDGLLHNLRSIHRRFMFKSRQCFGFTTVISKQRSLKTSYD